MYYFYPLVILLPVLPIAITDASPLVIPWSTKGPYGPDGPWSAVTVQVGSSDGAGIQPLNNVDLYPGGIWESMILRKSFCNDNGTVASDRSSPCLAEEAGLYVLKDSKMVYQGFTNETGLIWQWASNEAQDVHGMAENVLDTMKIPTPYGTFTINNSTISAVQEWHIGLPDGVYYSAQVGTLSLGAPGLGIQTFGVNATGQTAPGYAYAQGMIASNSWGLHYGSASLKQEGSLVFGGYDQSRVLGDVGAFDLDPGAYMLPNLLDIQIGVETGSSPFSKNSYTGLLKLNASFKGVQPAVINPIVPYLFMSPETCAAVAENLPVTLDSQLGLYVWNTTDPHYERILKSPAYLAFIFQKVGNGNLTIKMSFQLLNLTLEAPIVPTVQQYFPCRPFRALDNSGRYFLGKAFLQAAFIGMNWQEEKFFLAQAPGPGVGAPNIKSIGSSDVTINSDPIENFAVTWANDWNAPSNTNNHSITTAVPTANGTQGIPNNGSSNILTVTPTSATDGKNRASRSELSSGTKAGIAVGITVAASAIAGTVLASYMRRRKTGVPPQEVVLPMRQDVRAYEKDGVALVAEIGQGLDHEADNDHEIHELGVNTVGVNEY